MQQNHQNDHTKPHDVNPTPANQFASTVGSNNMQNNHGQGSGSGSSYRAPDPSNMVKLLDFFVSNHSSDENIISKIMFISRSIIHTLQSQSQLMAVRRVYKNHRPL